MGKQWGPWDGRMGATCLNNPSFFFLREGDGCSLWSKPGWGGEEGRRDSMEVPACPGGLRRGREAPQCRGKSEAQLRSYLEHVHSMF